MRRTSVLAILLAGSAAVVGAVQPTPGIGLVANERLDLDHPRGDPLLLLVTLYNARASEIMNRNLRNAEVLAAIKASADYGEMSPEARQSVEEEYAPVDVPAFTLGSPGRPMRDLVRIVVTDDDGKPAGVVARPLASTSDSPAEARFEAGNVEMLFFGIESGALAPGTYTLRAVLDTSTETTMWRGRVVSPPVTVRVHAGDGSPPTIDRLHTMGIYSLLDHDFQSSLAYAQRVLARDAASIPGLVLAGDSLDGLGRPEEALRSFLAALDIYAARLEKSGGRLEPPDYITARIVELQEELGQRDR